LQAVVTSNRGTYENPPDLSPDTWLTIRFSEGDEDDSTGWSFIRNSCMHCTDAACVAVCPSGALFHNEYGIVSYDKEKCIGCGYCAEFCPFNIPRLGVDPAINADRMNKCTMCTSPGLDRIAMGLEPACVKTCPTQALIFGDRDKLIAQGREVVSSLNSAHPNSQPQARLYGETELGGLHVLYVLADSPETYNLPPEPEFPAAATIQRDVFRPFAWIVWAAVAAGLALNVIVARARQIHSRESK